MNFKNEEMIDIQNICRKLYAGNLTIEEANKSLEKYGLEKSAFSLDGKAILNFSNGKTLKFANLAKNINKETESHKHVHR